MPVMPDAVLALLPLHAKPDDLIEPLVGWRYLTAWTFPWWVVVPLVLFGAAYMTGVRVLHRRGDRWPLWRTFSFMVLGLGVIAVAVFSFLGVYDTVLFWTHMVQHMLLNLIAPVFLVSGAPMTLALRALRGRPRELLLKFVHSWVAKVLLFPPLTFTVMIASPFVLYLTGWYDLTLRNDFHHDLLHIYMVVVGCAFFQTLLGVDPQPYRIPYPLKILMFILTMPFHAFLGVIIMGSERLIAEEWYLAFERDWGLSPIRDQNWAGGLMWATGDLTMAAAMAVIFVRWIQESSREAKRHDRMMDREEARARAAAAAENGLDSTETQERSAKDAT